MLNHHYLQCANMDCTHARAFWNSFKTKKKASTISLVHEPVVRNCALKHTHSLSHRSIGTRRCGLFCDSSSNNNTTAQQQQSQQHRQQQHYTNSGLPKKSYRNIIRPKCWKLWGATARRSSNVATVPCSTVPSKNVEQRCR